MENNKQPIPEWAKPQPKKKWKWWQILLIVLFILFIIGKLSKNDATNNSSGNSSTTNASTSNEVPSSSSNVIQVGQTLKSDMFEIRVNKVEVSDWVNTGNEFADLKREDGSQYIVFNATFKNIDTESRMLIDGKLTVNYNGKDYDFDKSETILLDGWGLVLDQINPLVSKTTNIVYKVPKELKGDVYWVPGRTSGDEKILLGAIKM
ncbi:DUF4352 domain-containing protein [Mucilaginibacter sp.]|uniref:DUF4352 domain-containing protein n=1 Tax=Mucilaginibacter sp. TaxID=1882438 RepID=UPI00261295B4|nr:DUF4352 domain-containing protein [Mucilaginibacter sp.]MDB5030844.1 hypothetical protein [Mucilaginibacter sp.]